MTPATHRMARETPVADPSRIVVPAAYVAVVAVVMQLLLLVGGAGSALAAVFDISHPLHNLAGLLGTLGFAIAAALLGVGLSRTEPWSRSRSVLLWTGHLPWIALVLFIAATVLLGVTFVQAGGQAPPDGQALPVGTALPAGTIAIDGWFSRLIIVAGAAWIVTTAWRGIAIRGQRP